jgi:hypothetical protein
LNRWAASKLLHSRIGLPNADHPIIQYPVSSLPETSSNIIQKGLAFGCERSGGGGGERRRANRMEIPMPKLTDTQLIILSTASQRDDRGVELPANLKGGAARKAVDKLIRAAR